MKRMLAAILAIGSAILLSSAPTKTGAQTAENLNPPLPPAAASSGGTESSAVSWPLAFSDTAASYTIYPPQCDSWNGHRFVGRSAVAIQPYGQAEPTYGVIEFNALTLVDKNTQTAKLADVKISGTDFSGAERMQKYLPTLRSIFSEEAPPLALGNLESSLVYTPPERPARLINTPPNVVVANRPAVLVSLDGPPVWRPAPGTILDRAINTRVLLLRDASGRYYLHVFDGFLQADSLQGPWTVASQPPADLAVAQKAAVDAGLVDLMQGTPNSVTGVEPSLSTSATPEVFVETKPSELITFSGAPEYAPIPDTDLLYADNTSANVFKLLTDQQDYILISGRWYRAPSLDGPWQFVPGNQLPADFAEIPDTSPKENVKASVPGTPQAEEALIANSIPQSAAVPVNETMENPQIDGGIQLAPIAGTPLDYVVNSATPIIEVNPELWYACQDGVWYDSTSANGPWTAATSVPPVIYTIP
ncbi:MAG TPA: hypothetical protein VL970_01100, partial [Candidatus Acidoferrales bacterium]|nr:hypothetical protein [Candidatus Acidoferrales bacterium]